jgi:hypothetical protein
MIHASNQEREPHADGLPEVTELVRDDTGEFALGKARDEWHAELENKVVTEKAVRTAIETR